MAAMDQNKYIEELNKEWDDIENKRIAIILKEENGSINSEEAEMFLELLNQQQNSIDREIKEINNMNKEMPPNKKKKNKKKNKDRDNPENEELHPNSLDIEINKENPISRTDSLNRHKELGKYYRLGPDKMMIYKKMADKQLMLAKKVQEMAHSERERQRKIKKKRDNVIKLRSRSEPPRMRGMGEGITKKKRKTKNKKKRKTNKRKSNKKKRKLNKKRNKTKKK